MVSFNWERNSPGRRRQHLRRIESQRPLFTNADNHIKLVYDIRNNIRWRCEQIVGLVVISNWSAIFITNGFGMKLRLVGIFRTCKGETAHTDRITFLLWRCFGNDRDAWLVLKLADTFGLRVVDKFGLVLWVLNESTFIFLTCNHKSTVRDGNRVGIDQSITSKILTRWVRYSRV